MELFDIIEDEVKNYENTPINVNPAFALRQGEIYSLIDNYWSSKFRDGDKDSLGYKKVFYNIVNFPTEVAAKMLDIDTKNIFLIAEENQSYWASWLMGMELKHWMKDKYFGRQLNEYALLWAKYGDLWVKKVGDDIKWVPPQNMIYRVTATDYKNIPLIEKHEYGLDELRVVGKQNGWNNVEEAIKKADSGPNGERDVKMTIYEVYFPKDYLNGDIKRAINTKVNPKSNYFIIPKDQTTILADATMDCPYKKLAWEKLNGRLAGRGRVEQLFEDQIYLNRLANYKSEGYHWTSKHNYQTKDTTIGKNLMTEVDNGEILIAHSPIEPIVNEERNLAAYNSDEQRWEDSALRKTFAREPITGGRAPAGTPLGSTILQTQMATGFYKQKKEDLADFLKEIMWDWLIPTFKNQNRKEHKLLFKNLLDGDEMNATHFFNIKLNQKMNTLRMKSKYLSPDQWQVRKANIAGMLKNEDIEIPRSLYDNLKYKINIIITGEQLDTASKQSTLNVITQILGSNPTILDDKRIERIIYKSLDYAGINPKEIFDDPLPDLQSTLGGMRQTQVGGSVASQQAPTMPSMGQSEIKV